jgi:hypothetical protein
MTSSRVANPGANRFAFNSMHSPTTRGQLHADAGDAEDGGAVVQMAEAAVPRVSIGLETSSCDNAPRRTGPARRWSRSLTRTKVVQMRHERGIMSYMTFEARREAA